MKRIFAASLAFSLLCSTGFSAAPNVSGDRYGDKDHLDPVDFEDGLEYRILLLRKLLPATENYGRVIFMPSSSEGESSVAVYSKYTGDTEVEIIATYTKAEKNLWNANFSADPNRAKEPTIKVNRIDAAIPKSTALAIREAWKQMLYRTRPPGLGGGFETDATTVEFALIDKMGEARYGVLPIGRGKHTEALYQLAKLLVSYCQAEGPKQKAIAEEIERRAKALVEDLKKVPCAIP